MTTSGSGRFPKTARLRKRAEYLTVQKRGRKVQGEHLLVLHLQGTEGPRVGVTVSSRVGNAVVRNRLKRWLREFLRTNLSTLPSGDVVVVVRASAAAAAHSAIDQDLADTLGRLREGRR